MWLASCAYTEFYPMTVVPIGTSIPFFSTRRRHTANTGAIHSNLLLHGGSTEDGRSVLQGYLGFILGG